MKNRSLTRVSAVAVASTAMLTLAACSGGGGSDKAADEIVFWTQQTTPERLSKQEATAAVFTKKTGIKVKVVPLAAADQNQALLTGAASGKVPDVIMQNPQQTAAWADQGLLETDVAADIVKNLGEKTFGEQSLELVTLDGKLSAVPSDGWSHVITYRKDLLSAAGLEPPKTIEEVADISTKLNSGKMTGIALGTEPGTPSSTEALESVLQSAGCQLVTDGKVTFDSQPCVDGLKAFKTMNDSSAAGTFDVPAARAAYLSGNAAMLLFSTHIIDELDGLDPDNIPSCEQCKGDPKFLAKNSGFVTVLGGAGSPQFGTTLNYGVPTGANTKEAQQYIEFLMSDGYLDTLGIATEGRVPLRAGTEASPTEYVDAWGKLPFGVLLDNKESIADVYGADFAGQLTSGTAAVSRWGTGKDSTLAGLVVTQNTLSQELEALFGGESPEKVAKTMSEQVQKLQDDLE